MILGLLLVVVYQKCKFPSKNTEAELNLFFMDPILPIKLDCKEANRKAYLYYSMNLPDRSTSYFDNGYDYFEVLANNEIIDKKSFEDIMDNTEPVTYSDYVSVLDLYERTTPKDDSLMLTLNVYKKGLLNIPFKVASYTQYIDIVRDNETYTTYEQTKSIGVYRDFECSRNGIVAGCVRDVEAHKSGHVKKIMNVSIISRINANKEKNGLVINLGDSQVGDVYQYVSSNRFLNSQYNYYSGTKEAVLYPSEGRGCYSIIPRLLIDSMRLNTYSVSFCGSKDSLLNSVFAGERIRQVDYTFCKALNVSD